MYSIIRSILFRFEPESVHNIALNCLRFASQTGVGRSLLRSFFDFNDEHLKVNAFGLTFKNPIGLSAGYDKNAIAIEGLSCLGFSHIEIGTVTLNPQSGNPKPRVFRLIEDRAIINRMGFPNDGAEAVLRRLKKISRKRDFIIGVNIGKSRDTPLDKADEDYLKLLRLFYDYADYISINISSPNTPELRKLQTRRYLENLLNTLIKERDNLTKDAKRKVPILVKIAPDLSFAEIDDAIDAMITAGIDGVIATNTTLARDGISSNLSKEIGGLSGAPLLKKSTEIVSYIYKHTEAKLPIVAVGGIFNYRDVQEKLSAGAVLVQIYTGLIYNGPYIVKNILKEGNVSELLIRNNPPYILMSLS